MWKFILLAGFFSVYSTTVYSQKVDELKERKTDIELKIELTNQLIVKTTKSRITTINDIKLIERQIENRTELIGLYEKSSVKLKDSIAGVSSVILDLTRQIDDLKDEYAKLILSAHRRKIQYNEINFFLGSDNFNEAYRKFILLNEYNKYRRKQGEVLLSSKQKLDKSRQSLSELKYKNEEVLKSAVRERQSLQREVGKKNGYLAQFKNKEKQLLNDIKNYEKSLNDLNNKIQEELLAMSRTSFKSTDFGKMIGKLGLPVKSGVVISKFGEHNHPVLKTVKIKNNGIDIKIGNSKDVVSVFEGEVSRVVGIPGYNKAVIVRHGKYLTVYANLIAVSVKNGQKIDNGVKLGEVYSGDGENSDVLHFEIWEENVKQNPENWLLL